MILVFVNPNPRNQSSILKRCYKQLLRRCHEICGLGRLAKRSRATISAFPEIRVPINTLVHALDAYVNRELAAADGRGVEHSL